jgi:hypothetical protein
MTRNRVKYIGGLLGVALVLTVVALVATGGSSSSAEGGTQQINHSASSAAAAGPDPVAEGNGEENAAEVATAVYPNGHDSDELSISGAHPVKPCLLVTRSQAREILGGKVKMAERLQGPTCVYSANGREVSMIVEDVSMKALVAGARKSQNVTAAGHHGYCLQYETSSVVFAVGGGRVLQVTGACQAGVRFATLAIPNVYY